ncbi:MAG TPA: helix-turn-helix transcriptional regulator [Puia sp.]|nr:helix-turn-helix transcriptional regulator [Puia sp.]
MQVVPEINHLFYLFDSPFRSISDDFFAFRLEDYDKSPHACSMPSFRTLFYQIGLITGGSIDFSSNELIPTIGPCTLCFFSPFHITAYRKIKNLKGQAFLFKESFIKYSYQNTQFHSDFPFFWSNQNLFSMGREESRLLLQIGEKIIYEYQNQSYFTYNIIRDYLHIFLLESKRITRAFSFVENNSMEYNLLQQFYVLVNSSYPPLRSVEYAAGMLYVTPAHLWWVVKKLTGQSPLEIINQRLLTEAKSLLLHSKLTISEIGYFLQFKEKSHFTRFFKNLTGIPPVDFTRQTACSVPDFRNG